MNREPEALEPIGLGTVSADTKGMALGRDDHQGGLFIAAGLETD